MNLRMHCLPLWATLKFNTQRQKEIPWFCSQYPGTWITTRSSGEILFIEQVVDAGFQVKHFSELESSADVQN
jgi:hypothetical protein